MTNLTAFGLSDEQQMFRETIRRMAEEKIKPRAAEIDESGEFPWDIVELFREYGLMGVAMPEAYGGTGADLLTFCIAVEEVARACATPALIIAAQHLGAMPILIAGNEEQKRRYLPAIAQGERLSAFGLTESEAGSDAGGTKTRAVRNGDDYLLTGSKVFITNGGLAKTMVVFASTDPSKGTRGISAFIVELDQHGVSVGRIEKKMGIRGSQTAQLLFDNVRVSASNRLGKKGKVSKLPCAL